MAGHTKAIIIAKPHGLCILLPFAVPVQPSATRTADSDPPFRNRAPLVLSRPARHARGAAIELKLRTVCPPFAGSPPTFARFRSL